MLRSHASASKLAAPFGAAALFALAPMAQADVITYSFFGEIDSVLGNASLSAFPNLAIGQTMRVDVELDSLAIVNDPSGGISLYQATSYTVSVGGDSVTAAPSNFFTFNGSATAQAHGSILVADDNSSQIDITLNGIGDPMQDFGSGIAPLALDLATLTGPNSLIFGSPEIQFGTSAITALQVVPAPGVATIFALAGVASTRRRRRG